MSNGKNSSNDWDESEVQVPEWDLGSDSQAMGGLCEAYGGQAADEEYA
jgi:hypothetical protein